MSDDDKGNDDNVVNLSSIPRFVPSERRRPGETPADYRQRYRREKKAWEKANGITHGGKVHVGSTNAAILRGEINVEDLTVEELVRGRPKAADGTFRGANPRVVPKAFHDACIKELMKRGQELYRDAYLDVVKVFIDIAKDPKVEPADRLRAAKYVWERIEGKVPDKVEIGGTTDPWQQVIDGIVAEVEDEQIQRAKDMLNDAATTTEE
jgi:hypothetical protein